MASAFTLALMRTTTYKYLEARPKSRYRQLFIKDRRIMADNLYRAHINKEEPRTPEQLAADYNVPVEAVLEAIEYGQSNPPEVVADFAREEAIMAASGMWEPDYKYCGKPRILSPEEWNDLLS